MEDGKWEVMEVKGWVREVYKGYREEGKRLRYRYEKKQGREEEEKGGTRRKVMGSKGVR